MSLKDVSSAACPENLTYALHIYPQLSTEHSSCCRLTATKDATATEVIKDVIGSLSLDLSKHYVLVEVKETGGEEWVLDGNDPPVHRVLLWPRRAQDDHPREDGYYFVLQERNADGTIKYVHMQQTCEEENQEEARRLVERGFLPWQHFNDMCNLPNLTESTLLENLKRRFLKQKIYTYVGSILIAINPFKFLPIYNPKYVQMYENHQLGKLEPHIFAIADVAYHAMLKKHMNQCIVISGESGSGKTQSTNFLIHCLTALSQKGYASGVERTILGAGPVLEVNIYIYVCIFTYMYLCTGMRVRTQTHIYICKYFLKQIIKDDFSVVLKLHNVLRFWTWMLEGSFQIKPFLPFLAGLFFFFPAQDSPKSFQNNFLHIFFFPSEIFFLIFFL